MIAREELRMQYLIIKGDIKDNKVTHLITSKAIRDTYYLYEVSNDDKLIKTKHKASEPTELEKWIYKNKE